MATGRAASDTPVPTTEKADPGTDGAPSTVTEAELSAMSDLLSYIYAYRNEEWVNLSSLLSLDAFPS